MRPPVSANPAVRRFAAVWVLSTAAKVAGLAIFLLIVLKFFGGI